MYYIVEIWDEREMIALLSHDTAESAIAAAVDASVSLGLIDEDDEANERARMAELFSAVGAYSVDEYTIAIWTIERDIATRRLLGNPANDPLTM